MTATGILPANRILRPYDGLENFETLLDNLEFKVKGRSEWTSSEELVFQFDDYIKPNIQVRLNAGETKWVSQVKEALSDISVKASDIDFVCFFRTPGLKLVRELVKRPLQTLLKVNGEVVIDFDLNSEPQVTPNQDSVLEFYLVLAKNDINKFPMPYLRGTWLTQRLVNIKCENKGSFDFDWLPLDAEERKERNLHKNSLHFVESIYPLHEGDSLSECTKAYLDPDFKSKLENLDNLALQKYLLANLVSEVISSNLIFTFQKLRRENGSFPLWAEIEDQGMLGKILRTIASKGTFSDRTIEAESIYSQFAEKPELVKEYVEDFFKLRSLGLGFEISMEEL